MKICPNCGCSVQDNVVSCHQCGTHISKNSQNNRNIVKDEIIQRAIKSKKATKLMLIPGISFLLMAIAVIFNIITDGNAVFLTLMIVSFLVFFVSLFPVTANLKREDAIASATYSYLERKGKLELLDTLTNAHIVMVSPTIYINDKMIACPGQGVAIPIEDIDEIVGSDQGAAKKKIAMMALAPPVLWSFKGSNGKRSYTTLKEGVRFFTKDNSAFDIQVNKYEFSRLLKKNPELLHGNIKMIDIF